MKRLFTTLAHTALCCLLFAALGASAAPGEPTLIINEIAWAGTAAGSADEWIELYNASDTAVALDGWTLIFGETIIHLGRAEEATLESRAQTVEPGGYLLLERTDDTAVADVSADVLYKGSLSNGGATLSLKAPSGEPADVVSAGDGWPAGAAGGASVPYATMERVGPGTADWATNNGILCNGVDASGAPLQGTPGAINSATLVAMHAPSITWTTEVTETVHGILVVTWDATDPDTDVALLRITVELSADDAETWLPIASRLANTGSYAWDTTGHPDAEACVLRLTVDDGEGYSSHAVSPQFAIDNVE